MSAPRLFFLYPFLFAPAKQAVGKEVSRTSRRAFRTASRKSQTTETTRYGTANEPPAHLNVNKQIGVSRPEGAAPKDAKALPKPTAKDVEEAKEVKEAKPKKGGKKQAASATSEVKDNSKDAKDAAKVPIGGGKTATTPSKDLPFSPVLDATEALPVDEPRTTPHIPSKNPMETVLNMPSSDDKGTATAPIYIETAPSPTRTPEQQKEGVTEEKPASNTETYKPPHISTPPYVHHFDTYGLVKRLEEGGWTQLQAVTVMKAVRLVLADNMELARQGLVSKSNVENNSYLFRAACSELKTDILTKRKAEAERSRTERTQLQHEVDILGQRMTQESGNLKDELKGMFDDRKMNVRNEQREQERKIQELNYKITVHLNSDSRSDVEGVRWIITKRAISALAICVAMILGSIKFSSSVAGWQEDERKRLAQLSRSSGNNSNGGQGRDGRDGFVTDGENSPRSQEFGRRDELQAAEILVRDGTNPAFVSLG